MREKKKMLVRVRSESPVSASHEVKRKTTTPRLDKLRIAESIPLTPLSHNIPRRARTAHAKDDETIVESQVHLVFVNKDGKPVKIPDEIYSKFKPYFCDTIKT